MKAVSRVPHHSRICIGIGVVFPTEESRILLVNNMGEIL